MNSSSRDLSPTISVKPDRNAEIIRLRREGVGPREIAKRFNVSPGLVSGVLYRAGLTKPHPPAKPKPPRPAGVRRHGPASRHSPETVARVRQMYAEGATYSAINAATGVKFGSIASHLVGLERRSRRVGRKDYDRTFRVMAVAAHLCGKSYAKVAAQLGCYEKSVFNWSRIPDLRAEAQAVADRVKAEFAVKAAEVAARKAQDAADRRELIDEINAPILARMPSRHRAILERRINGVSLQILGDDFGVTRERVRQIEVKWRGQGLVIPDARPLSEAGRRLAATLNPHPSRRPQKPNDFWAAANAVVERECRPAKAAYRITDAERQRRSEWMREVSRRRWEARA